MHSIYNLNYTDIPDFLTEKQIAEHFKLYTNYYNQTSDLPAKINGLGVSNPASIRGNQKTLQYALAGRDLHEIYFEGLTASTTSLTDMTEDLKTLIEQSFVSVEAWASDFTAVAMAARGWAILELDPRNNTLYNVCADFHDEGGTIGFKAIIALDMYEHAYFYDYQTNKKDYISKWWQHINWEAASQRLA